MTGFSRPTPARCASTRREITGLRPDVLSRRGVARTFQVLKPLPRLTVEENVMIGAIAGAKHGPMRAEGAAAAWSSWASPTSAADLARSLSTGQRKRLEMARAMATQPGCCCSTSRDRGRRPAEHPGA